MAEEDCDVHFMPLFANSTTSQYKIRNTSRTVTCKTRNVSSVLSVDAAANGLFADNLWPGCFVMADFLASNEFVCRNKTTLELGAGSALPSVVAGVLGARTVVVTDYPEQSVINNIEEVMRMNRIEQAVVRPHLWGNSAANLTACVENALFDVLLLAEVLWKDTHHLHDQLLQSVSQTLDRSHGVAIMTFVHRETESHTAGNDLEFFTLAEEKYGIHSKCLGQCFDYKDVFDDSNCNVAVNVYILFYDADVSAYSL